MSGPEVIDCAKDEPDDKFVYPDCASLDEQRRAFLIEHVASADIDGKVMVTNLALLEAWLRDGKVPEPAKRERKLKEVAGEAQ